MLTKKELRQKIIKKRYDLTDEEVVTKSSLICNKIINNKCYHNCETIYCYFSVNNEVSLKLLIEHALKNNKNVAFPKVEKDNNIRFYLIQSLTELTPGYYNIPEPEPNIPAPQGDLIVVPGVAFSKEGARLGYGGGFYDRFLANNDMYSIGVGYDFQIIDEIPILKHDIMMNEIITD